MDALPLTASGKVVKRKLVHMVQAGALQPRPVRFNPVLTPATRDV